VSFVVCRARRVGALGALLVLAGCGTADVAIPEATPVKAIAAPQEGFVPADALGLRIAPEDATAALQKGDRAFVDRFGLYSLRREEELMASLQVSRVNGDDPDTIERFRDAVITDIGSSRPREVLVGDEIVYFTTGERQQIAFWFRDRWLFVLSMREELTQRRALLRRMLEIRP
jgi:hypothetical protein